ncbi:MAG: RidA family protein [Devosia sp.]
MSAVEDKLAGLGITLPEPGPVGGNYVPYRIDGSTLYMAGQGPRHPDGRMETGKVGQDVTTEEAYEHAKLTGLNLLAQAKAAVGDLDRLSAVKLLGMVNAVPDFKQQPQVINGCSDLFVEVMGEKGQHARSAVGMGSLPGGITVEIEVIFRID